jgi:hypothetical protein
MNEKDKEKKNYNKAKPLIRYNKIVSIIIKKYKKTNQKYDISEVRKLASLVYVDFRKEAISKIPIKKVEQSALTNSKIEIKVTDVPNSWFDDQDEFMYWYLLGDYVNGFANAYPTIPIMLITKKNEKNPLVVKGATGIYDGSIFQRFVEDIRDSLTEPTDSPKWVEEIGIFFGTRAYFKGKLFAVWFEEGIEIEKIAMPTKIISPKKRVLIDEAEEKEKKRREIEKPKTKRGRPKKIIGIEPLPKVIDKKPKIKPLKPIEKPTANRVTEIRNLIAEFRQDLKDGLISKETYADLVKNLTSKLEQGGQI